MVDVKKIVSSYMENIKKLFKKSKTAEPVASTNSAQTTEPTQEKISKQKQMNDYIIDWISSFLNRNDKLKNTNLSRQSSDGQQYLDSYGIEEIKKYAHYLPIWKEMGFIEYSGENLEKSVETISSELYTDNYRNQSHKLYNEKTLTEYLATKPEIETLFANIDNDYMRDKLGSCITMMEQIDAIISKPHSTVPYQIKNKTVPFVNSKDSGLIEVYLGRINSVLREVGDLLQYYNRATEKNDTKTIEMMEARYGIKKLSFQDLYKLQKDDKSNPPLSYSELEDKYDTHKILQNIVSLLNNDKLLISNVFQPKNSQSLNDAIFDITNNVTAGSASLNNNFFTNYVYIIKQYFAENENFNKIFFQTTPPTLEEAEKLAQDTFSAVKEAIDSSYLKVGIDLQLKFEEENLIPGQQEALGTFSKTNDNKGVITIYRKQLKRIIDKVQTSPIVSAQIISTIFHESGHAIDSFWQEISGTKNTPSFIAELKNTLGTGVIAPEDVYFISCVSPSFKSAVSKMIDDGSTLEDIAKMINEVEYYELKEEHVARKTSKNACMFLFEQLAPYYQNDEIKAQTIEIIASSIDVISGTYYSYEDLEKTDKVETLAETIKQDMSTIGNLSDIENLSNNFNLSNFSNQQVNKLSAKASRMFQMYYFGLPEDTKREFIRSSIINGSYPILEMISTNDIFHENFTTFSPDDMIEYYRAVACRIKNGDGDTSTFRMASAIEDIYGSSVFNENNIDYVFTILANDNNLDEMSLFLDNYSFRKHFSPIKLHSYLVSIPENQRTEQAYASILSSTESILRYHKNHNGEDSDQIEKLMQYTMQELHQFYENVSKNGEQSTNLQAIASNNLLT